MGLNKNRWSREFTRDSKQERYEGAQITPTIALNHTHGYQKSWFEMIVLDHLELIVLIGFLMVLLIGIYSVWFALQGGG